MIVLGSDDRQDQSAEDVTEKVVLFLPTLFLSDSHKTLTSECVHQNDRRWFRLSFSFHLWIILKIYRGIAVLFFIFKSELNKHKHDVKLMF